MPSNDDKPSHVLKLTYKAWDAFTLDNLLEHIQQYIIDQGLSLEAGPVTRIAPGDHRNRPEKRTPMDSFLQDL